MNYPWQPCFFTRLAPLAFVFAGVAVAASLDPARALPFVAAFLNALWRAWVYAASIVLEAAPFVLAGSVLAALLQRFARSAIAAPLLAALAPGCDCAMNGFVSSLRDCPSRIAGMSLVWGAACNPIALASTATILGSRVLAARIVGGAVAAALVGLFWGAFQVSPQGVGERCDHHTRALGARLTGHLEGGLRLLLPAAFAAASLLVLVPDAMRAHASPAAAAIAAAILSPCSTADAILAKVIAGSRAAEAAFVIAAQCTDIRQFALFARHFGVRHAALVLAAGAMGCFAAVAVAR